MKIALQNRKITIYCIRVLATVSLILIYFLAREVLGNDFLQNINLFEALLLGLAVAVIWYLSALPFMLLVLLYDNLIFRWATRKLIQNMSPDKVIKVLGRADETQIHELWDCDIHEWTYLRTNPPIQLDFKDNRLDRWRTPLEYDQPELFEAEKKNLQSLEKLHEQGILTDKEFNAAKKRI